jgi:N-acetylneuraminate synthase
MRFNFDDLFVLDLANNHQGDVKHGLQIIEKVGEVVRQNNVRAAFKFQFRDLNTFIHPDYRKSDHKMVKRFLSTEISWKDFETLLAAVKKAGMYSMCTPFDEPSVDRIFNMGFDIIKVASCSAKDWPLLEKVAEAGMPTVFSTGSLTIHDIDNLVSFFDHRGIDYSIMHCVSIYPTPDEHFQLNQIDFLKNRYPSKRIGWSTHENPDDMLPIAISVAKGAKLFERHVGIQTEKHTLNAYSSTPQQLDNWFKAFNKTKIQCGAVDGRPAAAPVEIESIESLKRGVFASQRVEAGQAMSDSDVFFAMPYVDGQLSSGSWKTGIKAVKAIEPKAPVLESNISSPVNPERMIIQKAIHEVKAMLNQAKIVLSNEFRVEYSHQYGISNFRETGAVIIDCVNRNYCKKLIVQLPGQHHPLQYHKLKEEFFQVLYGTLRGRIDGKERTLHAGETVLILPGVWHEFWTETGVIFEEVSTKHINDDSYYADKKINIMKRHERKTVVDHWGRFQLMSEMQEESES